MTTSSRIQTRGIARRTVLKGVAAASAIGFVGVPATSRGVAAQPSGETLYLTDSGLSIDDDGGSKLFEVTLDDVNMVANLTLLAELDAETGGNDWYDQVDALAASPDGSAVYAIDKFSKHLGVYDVDADTFTDRGAISGLPNDVVQAAFSPSGVLYASSDTGDDLYVIDASVPSVTETITLADGFDMRGADVVFGADGTLYIFTNGGDANGVGLYKIDDVTAATQPISPEYLGTPERPYFTGLAIRDAGEGVLVASTHTYDSVTRQNGDGSGADDVSRIFTVEPTDGTKLAEYDTKLDGENYYVGFGDMTVGTLASVCESATFGLCAGQNVDVGTVTVAEVGGALTITYDLNEPWVLTESHVDVGDAFDDFHTNGPGNPQVGRFDLSAIHGPGVSSYTYTVECGDDALADVAADAETLYIAVHGVVSDTETDAQETAWVCGDQDGVDTFVVRGNWATYFTYDLCDDGGLNCSAD